MCAYKKPVTELVSVTHQKQDRVLAPRLSEPLEINADCSASSRLQTDLRSIGKGFLPADINSGRTEEVIVCVCGTLAPNGH